MTLQSLACVASWHSRVVVQVLRSRWCDGLRQLGGHEDVIKEYATSGDSQHFAARMVSRLSSLSSPSDLFCRLDAARLAHAIVRASRRSPSLARALDDAETPESAPMMAVAWIAEMKTIADLASSPKSHSDLCRCFKRLVRTQNLGTGCQVINGCAHEILARALFSPQQTTTKATTRREEGAFSAFAATGALGAALAERGKYTPRLLAAAQRALRNEIEPVLASNGSEVAFGGKYAAFADLASSSDDDGTIDSVPWILKMMRRPELSFADLAAFSFYVFLAQPRYHLAALLHLAIAVLECGDLEEFSRRHLRHEPARESYFQSQKRYYAEVMLPLVPETRHAAAKL